METLLKPGIVWNIWYNDDTDKYIIKSDAFNEEYVVGRRADAIRIFRDNEDRHKKFRK